MNRRPHTHATPSKRRREMNAMSAGQYNILTVLPLSCLVLFCLVLQYQSEEHLPRPPSRYKPVRRYCIAERCTRALTPERFNLQFGCARDTPARRRRERSPEVDDTPEVEHEGAEAQLHTPRFELSGAPGRVRRDVPWPLWDALRLWRWWCAAAPWAL